MLQRDEAQVEEPLASLLRCALVAFTAATLATNGVQYWAAHRGGPKALLVIAIVVAGAIGVLALEPHRPLTALRSKLMLWAYGYLLMTTAWGLWRRTFSAATDQAIVDRWRCVAFLLAMAVLFDDPRARRVGQIAAVVVAMATCAVLLGEALGVVQFHDAARRTLGRAGGLYVNPNQAGLAVVFCVAAGVTGIPRTLRLPVLLVAAGGVAATFSRGALLCLAVLLVVLVVQRELSLWLTGLAGLGVGLALAFTGGRLEAILDTAGVLNNDTLGRLAMNADDSGRATLAAKVWRMFLDSPWLGQGMATERQGRMSHNMYLSLGAEHGVLGFLVFPALALVIAIRNRPALGFALVLLLAGLFSHNLLEEEPVLFCAALAASQPLRAVAAVGEAEELGAAA